MERINILGIDVAKNVFSICGLDESRKVVIESAVSRKKLLEKVMLLRPKIVAMEACGSSNYWARVFVKHGIETKLISAKFVKPFVKSQKNDAHDAVAIAEACSRPKMRFVSIGTIEHQDIQSIHRIRERLIDNRTSLVNEIRGLLSEYGIVLAQGIGHVRKNLPLILEDQESELTARARLFFTEMNRELVELDDRIDHFDQQIDGIYQQHQSICDRMMQVEGIGIVTATALLTVLSQPHLFKNGRHFGAYLGLIPRQYSTGGRTTLRGITKHGNQYLRKLLIHGARSVINWSSRKTDARSIWIRQKLADRGHNKTCVALANKNARILWALLAHDQDYRKAA